MCLEKKNYLKYVQDSAVHVVEKQVWHYCTCFRTRCRKASAALDVQIKKGLTDIKENQALGMHQLVFCLLKTMTSPCKHTNIQFLYAFEVQLLSLFYVM
jgi:hypothetical protein